MDVLRAAAAPSHLPPSPPPPLQLFERFRPDAGTPPASLGSSRDYNVDLVPKFIMVREV